MRLRIPAITVIPNAGLRCANPALYYRVALKLCFDAGVLPSMNDGVDSENVHADGPALNELSAGEF